MIIIHQRIYDIKVYLPRGKTIAGKIPLDTKVSAIAVIIKLPGVQGSRYDNSIVHELVVILVTLAMGIESLTYLSNRLKTISIPSRTAGISQLNVICVELTCGIILVTGSR